MPQWYGSCTQPVQYAVVGFQKREPVNSIAPRAILHFYQPLVCDVLCRCAIRITVWVVV